MELNLVEVEITPFKLQSNKEIENSFFKSFRRNYPLGLHNRIGYYYTNLVYERNVRLNLVRSKNLIV